MNILHLQLTGNPGGVVSLCRDIANNSKDNNIIYFLFDGGTVADAIKDEGHQVVINEFSKKQWIKSALKLSEFCNKQKIDVIINHSNSPIAIFVTDFTIRRMPNIKWIMYFHSSAEDMRIWDRIKLIPFIRYQIKRANARIAISESVKKAAEHVFRTNEKIIDVVYNGVDTSRFIKKELNTANAVTFIYVGRLFPSKGVHILINAFALLKDMHDVRLMVVGEGEQLDQLEEQAKDLGLTEKITFYGLRMDIPELLLSADYFVHPAVWNEGFGITLVEAMSVGLPCIAFRKGAIPEIIHDDVNGYIIDTISAESMAEIITKCVRIRNTSKYKELSGNAIETSEKYSIQRMVNNLSEIIERC